MVFSASNYSLIPMEMMACGLPVVELDAESTRAVFPEGSVAFAPPTPHEMADVLQRVIESAEERERLRAAARPMSRG
jgi:glycosyltransferase involved in cell wall biosynthesis